MSEIEKAIAEANAAKVHVVNDVPVIVVPQGYSVNDFTNLLDAPRRYTRDFRAQDAGALIAYAGVHGNKNGLGSAVFHDLSRRVFTLVVDNDVDNVTGEFTAAWQQHTGEYKPEVSKEFDAWAKLDGRWIGQQDLAEFFEEHEDDFVQPTGAEIYQLVTNLMIKRNVTVASAVDLKDGTFSLQFVEEKGKGSVDLPETLTLGLPPFKNGERYEITAKLRYRLTDGKVAFQIKLRNADKALETAFNDTAETIRTALPALQHYNASAW